MHFVKQVNERTYNSLPITIAIVVVLNRRSINIVFNLFFEQERFVLANKKGVICLVLLNLQNLHAKKCITCSMKYFTRLHNTVICSNHHLLS
jgi:hypothetical protein